MLFKKRNLVEEESGSVVVIFSLFLVILMGIAGSVIDVGILYNTKSHLRKTAQAAVLSGAQELPNSNSSVNYVVNQILLAHGEENSIKNLSIDTTTNYKLSLTLEKEVPMYFLKLFNMDSQKVQVTSSAELAPMSSGRGAVPLGINKNIPLEYFKEYTLKVDSGDSEYGNFGILALSGPGAKLYEQDLMYGYDGELTIGDIINTETGNIEGKTINAIDFRLNSCNHPIDDYTERDCSRIILVLVYEPYKFSGSQLDQVKITGFAYFYLKEPVDTHDSSIVGYFIKRVGTGYGDKTLQTTGAYTVKLTE
ncbi:TadE/TadG family type IV pilus assembly protein [Clostridium sp. DL1XJH146]